MKTNLLISRLRNLRQTLRRLLCAQPNSPASLAGRGQQAGTPAHPDNKTPIKFAKYLIPTAILLLFLIAVILPSCKSPATLTSDTQHHARDSTRHTTVHRIETHDTIVIGPSKSPLKGDFGFFPVKLRGR